ncbi:MAG: hypothetical protein IT210_00605 [Armatimonadetes bacterium]|nr:hypothetical protein [Armatimonadota bacterium]
MDAWHPYHVNSGGLHCGTNAVRRLPEPAWWRY